MRVWLDDVRPPPKGYDIHVATARGAIGILRTGMVTFISFDHDLGAGVNKTGYDVAKWIEENAYSGLLRPIEWEIHSANPVGRNNIEKAMLNAKKFWNEDE